MPFLAPVAAPLIGLAGSVIGSIFGNKKSKAQSTAESAAEDLARAQADRQRMVMPAGQSSIDFYQRLLSGDRTATMSTLAPTIQNITAQYDTGRRNMLASLGPGGVRDKALASLDAGRVRDVGNLFGTAQSQGANALANIFNGNQADGGLAALTALSKLNSDQNSNAAGTGAQLGGILGQILFPTGGRSKTNNPVILSGSGSAGQGSYPGNIFSGGF